MTQKRISREYLVHKKTELKKINVLLNLKWSSEAGSEDTYNTANASPKDATLSGGKGKFGGSKINGSDSTLKEAARKQSGQETSTLDSKIKSISESQKEKEETPKNLSRSLLKDVSLP